MSKTRKLMNSELPMCNSDLAVLMCAVAWYLATQFLRFISACHLNTRTS